MSRLALYRNATFVMDHALDNAVVALGRHPENDIVLEDPTLSRFHARIETRADSVVLIDLGGQNGLFVNKERVVGEVVLRPGDRIGLGDYVGIFDNSNAPNRVREHEPMVSETAVVATGGQVLQTSHQIEPAIGHPADDRLATQNADSLIVDIESEELVSENGEISEALPAGIRKSETRKNNDSKKSDFGAATDELFPSAGEESDDEKVTLAAPDEQIVSGKALNTVNSHDSHADGARSEAMGAFKEPSTRIEDEPPFIPVLVLFHEGKEVSRTLIEDSELIIGRAQETDIQIALLGLSRKHAKIYRRKNQVFVEDLASQNGTWVNHVRANGPQVLQHGDLLNFYEYGLLYLSRSEGSTTEHFLARAQETPPPDAAESAPESMGELQGGALDELEQLLDEPSLPVASLSTDDGMDAAAAKDEDELLGEGAMLGDVFGEASIVDVPEANGGEHAPQLTEEGRVFDSTFLRSLQQDEDAPAGGIDTKFDVTIQQELPKDFQDVLKDSVVGIWPEQDDLERALRYPKKDQVVRIEVYFDEQLYTQVPLKQPLTRIGVDARCELALPAECALCPWHLTLFNFGAATIAQRMGSDARVYLGENELVQAVLRDGDELTLGRVRMIYRRR